MSKADYISSVEEIIEEAKKGKMFILVDDEMRENEGDLVIPAEYATSEMVNFMVKNARGLVCLTLEQKRAKDLRLKMMVQENNSVHQTPFTVSIEAKEGVTTGISAFDRACTIKVAIDSNKGYNDIVRPGHIFPLVSAKGGVLERAGHTEASVDISKIAGLNPSAVICEIMNDDGKMARIPDLIDFAQKYDLKIGTIADLIAYRLRYENFVYSVYESKIDIKNLGECKFIIYENILDGKEYLVLKKGDFVKNEEVLVRMHARSKYDFMLTNIIEGEDAILTKSIEIIAQASKGIIVFLFNDNDIKLSQNTDNMIKNLMENSKKKLGNKEQKWRAGKEKTDKGEDKGETLKSYGIGAQILMKMGVRKIKLITTKKKSVIGLEGFNLEISSYYNI